MPADCEVFFSTASLAHFAARSVRRLEPQSGIDVDMWACKIAWPIDHFLHGQKKLGDWEARCVLMRCTLNSFTLTGKTLTLYIVWVFGGFAGNNFIPTRCFLSSHFTFWTWNCIAVAKFWFETALVPSPVEVVAPLASTRTVWEAEGVATCPASQRRRTSVVRNWLRVEARVKGLDWLQASQVLCHVVVTAVMEATCEFSSAFGKDGCFYWWNSTKHSCVSCTFFLSFICLESNISSLLSPFCSSSESCSIHLQLTRCLLCTPYILFIITQE